MHARLAVAALRGVVAEVERDPALAAAVLIRLFPGGDGDVLPTDQGEPEEDEKGTAPVTEASRLVGQLAERVGSLSGAALRFRWTPKTMAKWKNGGPCSLENLTRLREALAELEREGEREEAPAATEVAFP